MKRAERKPGPPPTDHRLREAAIAHLARFAATEAGLARVLTRRVDRWVRAAEADGAEPATIAAARTAARAAIPGIIASLRALGAVNDAEFAASRARRLAREGKSRRATIAHLATKGIDTEVAARLVPDDATRDLAAACLYLRRRRLPPFGDGDRMRALGSLARQGFDRGTAERALALDRPEAEALVLAARRGDPG
ncbi:RecX family transcriptional regulator [Acidiphilium sp. PA]|uniref:RecX family transcriptional regulator n=1 Tax=Acidiphilium sp. PA TaxID=2871705 RepID=UPI0022434A6E|nr:RecX family transcriptional regulator [Acidiphilium sp. PA]MCW8308212.1 RecX family transcriptional regulator [Acidiphilium sp. PA]